jgi:DNA-binding CsgD family transcriptional regulator/PAS domain-containing protein
MSPASEASDVILTLYDAGVEPGHWPGALEQFAELFGASYGGLVLARPNGQIEQIGSLRSDPSYSRSYGEHYGRTDPVMPAVVAAAPGTVLTDAMVIPKAALERTEFYHDWVRPQGYYSVLAANFIREGDCAGAAVLSRRQQEPDFQQGDLDLLAAIIPHLQRSMRMHLRLASVRAERNIAVEALDKLTDGILVTDQSCRVLFANRAAEELLGKADGISSGRQGVYTATAVQTSELRRLVAQAAGGAGRPPAGGALLVDRPSMKRAFHILVSPLRAETGWAGLAWRARAVLWLIIDPERAPLGVQPHLRTLFKLTPAEARLASELAAGESLLSVAETLGILSSTARTHLHRVFEKTETQRQAELVKLVERLGTVHADGS